MKKIFTEAEVEVKAFELEDVITASGDDETPDCSVETISDRD